jgi:hypothetical protein
LISAKKPTVFLSLLLLSAIILKISLKKTDSSMGIEEKQFEWKLSLSQIYICAEK